MPSDAESGAAARAAPAVRRHADGRTRCSWCGLDPDYVRYHDTEWGRRSVDERYLFETLCLEGAQAGLSWLTVLRKRAHYRKVYRDFDAEWMARLRPADLARLLADPGIIRHRQKLEAFVANAQAYLSLQAAGGTLARLLDELRPARRRRPRGRREVPVQTAASEELSRRLVRLGFRFVGPTICYAYMQAVGAVDDHDVRCFVPARRR